MICEFLSSFSRRERKRPAPARGHVGEPRPLRDEDPLAAAPHIARNAQRGASE